MKITICGSIAFYDEMLDIKNKLENLGHEVKLPPIEVPGKNGELISVAEYYRIRKEAKADETWVWERKKEAIQIHFDKINWCDAILIPNYDKKNIAGYIGGNTLMEMGLAFHLGKKIYLLNPIPDVAWKEEIVGMQPIVINGDLARIV